jgi:ADP-ribose pyrophosphatase YjhB (NUDIX family)
MIQLITAGLIVIKNRKLLLAFSKNKQAWYLPGGKTDNDETTKLALIREIKEELNVMLEPEKLEFYTHITAPAFGEAENIMMEQDCFFYELLTTPMPNAEIKSLEYFDCISYQSEIQVPGVVLLMQQLRKDNLID